MCDMQEHDRQDGIHENRSGSCNCEQISKGLKLGPRTRLPLVLHQPCVLLFAQSCVIVFCSPFLSLMSQQAHEDNITAPRIPTGSAVLSSLSPRSSAPFP